MKLNINFSGITLLKDWWKTVKANFTTIESEYNNHQTASVLDHPNKSVKQQHIADKAVGTSQIADYSVGTTQLAQYSVSSAKIYPGAVITAHIKDGNVTQEKIADSAVTLEKMDIDAREKTLSFMRDEETYKNTSNDLLLAPSDSLFKTYTTRLGQIKGAPSDKTANSSTGYIEYLVLQVPLDIDDRIQIAININSHRKFMRRINTVNPYEWVEI